MRLTRNCAIWCLALFIFAIIGVGGTAQSQVSGQGTSIVEIENKGKILFQQGKYVEAFAAHLQAANLGSRYSEGQLGAFYLSGIGTTQDYGQAFKWLTVAAQQGNAEGEAGLAYMYRKGLGTTQDYSQAFAWYSKSAQQGNADGEAGLAYMYQNGLGTTQDYSQAFAWYSKSAQQGNADGETGLAYMYQNGLGTKQDSVQAFAWYSIAAQQGNSQAKSYLAQMDALPPPQRPIAQPQLVTQQPSNDATAQRAAIEQQRQEIADKIEDLKSDMEEHESEAKTWDNTAEEERNSGCSGPAAAICQSIGQIGVAKAQANANKERNAANEDRAEIERLQGKDVEAPRKLDSSFTGNLQQVTSQNPSVLQVGNQQAANMRAIGNANAAQQQAAASNNLAQPMYVAFSFSSLGLGGDGAWGAAIDQNEQMAIENSANRCVSTSQDSQSCGTGNGGRWPVCQADGKARWVALAINNDGKAEDWSDGEGIGYDNANGAQQAAMANCGKSGCQIVWTQFVSCTVGASALSASGQGVRNPSSGGATRSAGSTSTPSGQNQKGCVAQNEKDTIPGSQNWLACPGW